MNQVLPKNVSILFKPHPALTIQSSSKKQSIKFIDMSMSDALALSDFVITSSVTTGSLDAYLMKKTDLCLSIFISFEYEPDERNR